MGEEKEGWVGAAATDQSRSRPSGTWARCPNTRVRPSAISPSLHRTQHHTPVTVTPSRNQKDVNSKSAGKSLPGR